MKYIKNFEKIFELCTVPTEDTSRLKARIIELVENSDLSDDDLYKIIEMLSGSSNYPIH